MSIYGLKKDKDGDGHLIPIPEGAPNCTHDVSWSDIGDLPEEKVLVYSADALAFDQSAGNGYENYKYAQIEITGDYQNLMDNAVFSALDKLIIVFDGVEYELSRQVATVINLFYGFGNAYITDRISGFVDNGNPVIVKHRNGHIEISTLLTDETHDVELYVIDKPVDKLPEKYLTDHSHPWESVTNKPFDDKIVKTNIITPADMIDKFVSSSVEVTIADYVGKEVTIEHDGQTYKSTVTHSGTSHVIGDSSFTDIPCYIEISDYMPTSASIQTGESSTAHVEVYFEERVITTLDPKYLPEHLQFGEIEGETITLLQDYTKLRDTTKDVNGKTVNVYYVGVWGQSSALPKQGSINVTINGVVYSGEIEIGGTDSDWWISVGNNGLWSTSYEDTGENYCLLISGCAYVGNEDFTIYTTDEPTEVTLPNGNTGTGIVCSVELDTGYTAALDEKYIPETIARVEDTFVVTITTEDMINCTADKTVDEIKQAVNDGKKVYAILNHSSSGLTMKLDYTGLSGASDATFETFAVYESTLNAYWVSIEDTCTLVVSTIEMTQINAE